MQRMLLACFLGGCSAGGLPMGMCHYSLTTAGEGDAACSLARGSDITIALDGEHPIVYSVRDMQASGYARLENGNTTRHESGEIYGLSSLSFDGCDNWGGHATWEIAPTGWRLSLVATCARGALDALYLNGSIESK